AKGRLSDRTARVLIVDDCPIVRFALRGIIEGAEDMICCGEAESSAATQAVASKHPPDLVLLELWLAEGICLDLVGWLKQQLPQTAIMILSASGDPIYVQRALGAGADGYLTKRETTDQILNGIRSVLDGQPYLSPNLRAALCRNLLLEKSADRRDPAAALTNRELHVFQLIGAGNPTREIAAILGLSSKTVETHRENIKFKLGVKGAAALVHAATRWLRAQSVPNGAVRGQRC
ncbi:MAG: response regulator transcription factor, partial [Verrucomicrobiota bacterium]